MFTIFVVFILAISIAADFRDSNQNNNIAGPSIVDNDTSTNEQQPSTGNESTKITTHEEPEQSETIVYITNYGEKYHTSYCRTLKDSHISISLEDAKTRGYKPCGICRPPS